VVLDDGTLTTASADASTNYAAPVSISAQSYNETVGYTGWLGVAQTTGANGEQLAMTYDQYGRPSTGTSAYGAVTNYTYATSAPFWQTETGPNGVTTTTLDGLGRAIHVARGDSSSVHSYTDTVYAPCACSPLGKLQKVSQPYPSGSSASAWTSYTYDGLGRTLSVVQPDAASTTAYAYAGSQTTVTDPAGKWKTLTNDILGNLTTVVEPDPLNQPGGTLTTNYTYDWMNHVTQVGMTRGSTTQTRTFAYNSLGQLTSATNPENGTVTYTYNNGTNGTGNLLDKHDAKGQDTVYTYDSLNRVTEVQRYPSGRSNGEDFCARVIYTYDTNPVNSSFSQYSTGRLTTAQYHAACTGNGLQADDIYTEMYSYHPAGAVTAKNVKMQRTFYDPNNNPYTASGSVEADYTYDSAGRTLTTSNPAGGFYNGNTLIPATLTYSYDTMGRPSGLTGWVSNVQYDYASRLTGLSYLSNGSSSTEAWTYNVNGQTASLNWSGNIVNGGIQYVYSATQNNGQITQAVDTLSGETISYQYDALKRLTSAASTVAGTQTYQYDGFGNLTAKVLNGSSTSIPVNAATNQLNECVL
jgi:YD repeat-containing protein